MSEKMDTEFITDYAGRSAKGGYIQRPPYINAKPQIQNPNTPRA
jgi:hypothetical protein